tara:strand:+ start:2016 stop:2618 length:603 start_codon:yes stop_codon:yes gene_type:complete
MMLDVSYAVSSAATLANLLKKYNTYSADFEQTTSSHDGSLVSRSSGYLIVKKPNKFFWETKSPNHQKLYGLGDVLWVYDVDLAQATQRPLSQPGQLSPASILSGSGDELARYFSIAELDLPHSENDQIFKLTSNLENAAFSTIQITFKNHRLVSLYTLNNLGQKTLFTFSNIILDRSISDSQFKFDTNMKGVDVLRDSAV